MGRHRSAVTRVVITETIRTEVLTARSELIELLPSAVGVFRHVLEYGRGDLKTAIRLAIHLLNIMAVGLLNGFADSIPVQDEIMNMPDHILEFNLYEGRAPSQEELAEYGQTGKWPSGRPPA